MPVMSRVDAVLFDFDGTLINSDDAHLSAFNEALLPFQVQMSHADYATCAGRSNSAIFQDLLACQRKRSQPWIPLRRRSSCFGSTRSSNSLA